MGKLIDEIEFSGIVKVRDAILKMDKPYRLESGEPSFDVPQHIKDAVTRALQENFTHYAPSSGIADLKQEIVKKLQQKNRIPVAGPNEVIVTNGGMHGLYALFRALLEKDDEVIVPDPNWTCVQQMIRMCEGTVVGCRLYEDRGFKFDFGQLGTKITPRTKAILINSPHNPTGGVLNEQDIQKIADIVRSHEHLTLISDEAYEDVIYDGEKHVSPASLPGMYNRTISVFSFSKSYAMTGLRLGYAVTSNPQLMDRMAKVVLYSSNGICSVIQRAGVAALKGPQDCVEEFRKEFQARRDLFYEGLKDIALLKGVRPKGAFYSFLRISDEWPGFEGRRDSWAMTEFLLKAKVGSTPGIIFGPAGEGYVRFSTACTRQDLLGALEKMKELFSS